MAPPRAIYLAKTSMTFNLRKIPYCLLIIACTVVGTSPSRTPLVFAAEKICELAPMVRATLVETQTSSRYSKQDRGDLSEYALYFAGMDITSRQKVAFATSAFPTQGDVADMGSGSGSSSHDLAALFPGLRVIGVDINPTSVARARERYQRHNLQFIEGDVAERVFPDESLDAILNSSVGHHLTSFNNFDVGQVRKALTNHARMLRKNGILVYRDFVIPKGPSKVRLDLPTEDGAWSGDAPQLSTAGAFEDFARRFKSSVHRKNGVPYSKLPSPRPGLARYELDYRTAVEFILRKDYRKSNENWASELLEEYCYMTQDEFEKTFKDIGLRIVSSKPIYNQWIIENRFKNKIGLSALDGKEIPFPPTNYVIIGEKVDSSRSVALQERSSASIKKPRFLNIEHYRNKDTGQIYDLVNRPGETVDLIPWFEDSGQLYVMSRQGYPRPILNATDSEKTLNGSTTSGYISEPISMTVAPKEARLSNASDLLARRSSISTDQVLGLTGEMKYFPSPGGINEQVHSLLIQVKPQKTKSPLPNGQNGFSEPGFIHYTDATQALRSYQVGGMFDSRLENGIYHLLLEKHKEAGPWIGADVKLTDQPSPKIRLEAAQNILEPSHIARFEKVERSAKYLDVRQGDFVEIDSNRNVIWSQKLEYVTPKGRSKNTISAIPVMKSGGRVYVGIETRDLPAVQSHTGSSRIATNPAWRLPKGTTDLRQAEEFLNSRLLKDFNAKASKITPLGGEYYTSPGTTPEVVFPYAVEVDASSVGDSKLSWVDLEDLIQQRKKIQDGHLMTAAFRLAHALGLLPR